MTRSSRLLIVSTLASAGLLSSPSLGQNPTKEETRAYISQMSKAYCKDSYGRSRSNSISINHQNGPARITFIETFVGGKTGNASRSVSTDLHKLKSIGLTPEGYMKLQCHFKGCIRSIHTNNGMPRMFDVESNTQYLTCIAQVLRPKIMKAIFHYASMEGIAIQDTSEKAIDPNLF